MTGVLRRGKKLDTVTNTGSSPCDEEDREQNEASTSKGCRSLPADHEKLGERPRAASQRPQKEQTPLTP